MRAYTAAGIEVSLVQVLRDGIAELWIQEVCPAGEIRLFNWNDVLANPRQRAFYTKLFTDQVKMPVLDTLKAAWDHPVAKWFTLRDF